MDSHPDAHLRAVGPGVLCERALSIRRGGHGIAGSSEGGEEGVALRVDLLAAGGSERLTQQTPVRRVHVGPAVAQALDE